MKPATHKLLRVVGFIAGWALIGVAGWLKGGDESSPAIQLVLLVAGALVLAALALEASRSRPHRPDH